jgi:hypothetical protein
LKSFLVGDFNGGKIVTSNPRFRAHLVMMTTKSTSLTIEKCLICDYFYYHYAIVVASFGCAYHHGALDFICFNPILVQKKYVANLSIICGAIEWASSLFTILIQQTNTKLIDPQLG